MTIDMFSCRAIFRFEAGWPKDWAPLVCTREPGHEDDHEDGSQQNPLHDGPPHWPQETP